MRRSRVLGCLLSASLASASVALVATTPARAGVASHSDPEPAEGAPDKDVPQGPKPQIGPSKVELGDDLVLDLPAGMGYFDRVQGKELMEKMGNQTGSALRGLVFQKDAGWLMEILYVGDGYVKDDDAADLEPGEILKAIQEGTEEANEFRKQRGFKAIHVEGWTEPPRYERAEHHLIWGIKGKLDDGSPASVNFYTRVLGRRGYVALNLMDDPATIEASKVQALAVLRATTFKPGARYQDFDAKSDKVAEYGLAALVAGGAGAAALKLAKVGLLAKFGAKILALLVAGKKAVILAFIALAAGLKKLFGRKPEQASAPPPPQDPPAAAGPPPAP